ncbi:hypothetical protein [Desulfuromonas thiophila]|uniref:hypothetical protein n=1 Tax=Desulfuromonas thiophila TaxID=57664 RepID=UPI0029F56E67|nr:hypothetical protein [Desulfuromonas thiophila]
MTTDVENLSIRKRPFIRFVLYSVVTAALLRWILPACNVRPVELDPVASFFFFFLCASIVMKVLAPIIDAVYAALLRIHASWRDHRGSSLKNH